MHIWDVGKTTAIKRILPEYKSFLVLSSRQTFARFIAKEFGADCYLDGIKSSRKLVVSVESLLKVRPVEPYECIIIDECESILMQFSSHTTNGQHVQIWNQLVEHIQLAKKVVMADAFITNRTLHFARSLQIETTMIENKTSPVKRIAKEIHPNLFATRLIESIKRKEKNYVCYSSKTKLLNHVNMIRGAAIENEIVQKVIDNSIIYYGEGNDKVFDTLTDMNNTWGKADLIITSPTNTVGCSYSPPDRPPDINAVYICAAPTCCVRDTFQTQMRPRHLIDDKMYFSLPTKKSLVLSKSRYDLQFDILDEYENYNKEKGEIVMNLIQQLIQARKQKQPNDRCDDLQKVLEDYQENSNIPGALRQVLFFNLYEQTISGKFYEKMFYMFLEKCGYTVEGQERMIEGEKTDFDLDAVTEDRDRYEEIESITTTEQESIKRKIERKQATEVEKRQIKKYWFDAKISNDYPEKSEIYSYYYTDSQKKEYFDNAYLESRRTTEYVLLEERENSGAGFELNQMKANRLHYIRTINEKLGLKNAYSVGLEITRQSINDVLPYLTEEQDRITLTFRLRNQATSKEPFDFKRGLGFIQKIYKSWTGMELKGVEKNKHTEIYPKYQTFLEKVLDVFCGDSVIKVLKLKEREEENQRRGVCLIQSAIIEE